jgi:drug/metabolite transporter (DMT)-like permease
MIAAWTLTLFGDRLSAGQIAGICISLVGVVIIICHGNVETLRTLSFNAGDLLVVLSLVLFAFYSALTRRRPQTHWLSFLTFSGALGTLSLVPIYAWEISSGQTISFDWQTFAAILYAAIFPSLLSYLFFNRGVEMIGPNRAAPFLHLTPVFGSVLAIALLGERPEWFHALGYFLVLCGIAAAARRHRTA